MPTITSQSLFSLLLTLHNGSSHCLTPMLLAGELLCLYVSPAVVMSLCVTCSCYVCVCHLQLLCLYVSPAVVMSICVTCSCYVCMCHLQLLCLYVSPAVVMFVCVTCRCYAYLNGDLCVLFGVCEINISYNKCMIQWLHLLSCWTTDIHKACAMYLEVRLNF